MKIIGVTGGVGAGKSTVLNYLEKRYGAKLILADLVGHEVMEPGHEAYEQVVKVFGQEIVSEDKTIDRKALGAIVFADEKKRMSAAGNSATAGRSGIIAFVICCGRSCFISGRKL